MKKTLSIILSILMIAAVFAMPASAEGVSLAEKECVCEDHVAEGLCHCCLFCENLDTKYVTSCVKIEDGVYVVCCTECDGIFPCDCFCTCCPKDAENNNQNSGNTPIIPEDKQDDFIAAFQEILQKMVAFFDEFFNYIFEFLKLAEILPEENA